MRRFKLSRKEKLLFATPLLVLLAFPVAILVGPLVSADSADRRLRELAGPEAVDCGYTPPHPVLGVISRDHFRVPCAVAAFKAGKPFWVRTESGALARTPQGGLYEVSLYRPSWHGKSKLVQTECVNPRVPALKGQIECDYLDTGKKMPEAKVIDVWW